MEERGGSEEWGRKSTREHLKNERLGVCWHVGGEKAVENVGYGLVGVLEALESGGVEN